MELVIKFADDCKMRRSVNMLTGQIRVDFQSIAGINCIGKYAE